MPLHQPTVLAILQVGLSAAILTPSGPARHDDRVSRGQARTCGYDRRLCSARVDVDRCRADYDVACHVLKRRSRGRAGSRLYKEGTGVRLRRSVPHPHMLKTPCAVPRSRLPPAVPHSFAL
jgi:hypothetical protein